jgi:hypothetical protein
MPTLEGTYHHLELVQSSNRVADTLSPDNKLRLHRALTAKIDCALFLGPAAKSSSFVTDTANIVSARLTIRRNNATGAPLIDKAATGFTNITYSQWLANTARQFEFDLSAVDTNQALPASVPLPIYFAVTITTAARTFIAGSGFGEIVESGVVGVTTPLPPTLPATTISGNLGVYGNLNATGNTLLGGTLGVSGNTHLSGTLDVTGDTVLGGALAVGGNINIGGQINGHFPNQFDPKDFGAAYDAVTDDIAAFEACAIAAHTAGGALRVSGRAYLSRSLVITPNNRCHIAGDVYGELRTDKDIALLTFDTSLGRMDSLQVRDLTFVQTGIRNVTDGVTTSGSPVASSATANFTSQDVGKEIEGTGVPLDAYIGQIVNSTTIRLSSSPTSYVPLNATANGTGITFSISNANGIGILLTEAVPAGNFFADCHFHNLRFYGTTCAIRNTRSYCPPEFNGEANMNSCTFNNVSAWNNGLKYPKNIFRFDYGGGGTGNMFHNTSGIASRTCFSFGQANGLSLQNVGDIIISGFHLFGSKPDSVIGFQFYGGVNYNNQIFIAGGQVDNMRYSIAMNSMNEFEFAGNWGGGTQAVLVNCNRFYIDRDTNNNALGQPCVVLTNCTAYMLRGRNGVLTLSDQLLAGAVTLTKINRTIDMSGVVGNGVVVGPTVGLFWNNNASSATNFYVMDGGAVGMPRIPTSDPHVAGQVWRSGNDLKFSTG